MSKVNLDDADTRANEKHFWPRKVIEVLQRRKGFDGWWNEIYNDNQEEIIEELEEVFNKLRDMV